MFYFIEQNVVYTFVLMNKKLNRNESLVEDTLGVKEELLCGMSFQISELRRTSEDIEENTSFFSI